MSIGGSDKSKCHAAAMGGTVHHLVQLECDASSYRTGAAQNRRTEEESEW